FNRLHRTLRISQAEPQWLLLLQVIFRRLDHRSWIYREGTRNVWVIESSYRPVDPGERLAPEAETAFVRGYFDAEGGVPKASESRFYIQLVQKNKADLEYLRALLGKLGIQSGRIHNPSAGVDPDYWRFYVLSSSHKDFIRRVGSWHPRKRQVLGAMLQSCTPE
ncbi:MAG: LAGLIDADG family homing endonuclease, partial [bacterium]